MPKRQHVSLGDAAEQIDETVAETRRLAEEGELEAYRRHPTGPLLILQKSIDEYLDLDEDDDETLILYDEAYDEGYADGKAESECDD